MNREHLSKKADVAYYRIAKVLSFECGNTWCSKFIYYR